MEKENKKETLSCIICTDESQKLEFLPCCGKPDGDILYCRKCLEKLVNEKNEGKCIICKNMFKLEGEKIVKNVKKGKCASCCQWRDLKGGELCDPCMVGKQNPLWYICNCCGGRQKIPHPMYRYFRPTYQGTSGSTWYCHGKCNTWKTWKLAPKELGKIPYSEWPTKFWGCKDGEKIMEQFKQMKLSDK